MKALAITLLGLGMLAGPAVTTAFAKVHYHQGNLAAEDSDSEDSDSKDADAESIKPSKVAEALKKCGYLTDVRPRNAEIYFVFHARKDSEEGDILSINKTYKKMLRDKSVEVVMISEDQDTSDMKEFFYNMCMRFPTSILIFLSNDMNSSVFLGGREWNWNNLNDGPDMTGINASIKP